MSQQQTWTAPVTGGLHSIKCYVCVNGILVFESIALNMVLHWCKIIPNLFYERAPHFYGRQCSPSTTLARVHYGGVSHELSTRSANQSWSYRLYCVIPTLDCYAVPLADVGQAGEHGLLRSLHYNDVIMDAVASQIPRLAIVYSTVYSDADQRKHQSSASLAFVRGIDRWIPRTNGQ